MIHCDFLPQPSILVPAYVPVTTVPTTQPEDALGEYTIIA